MAASCCRWSRTAGSYRAARRVRLQWGCSGIGLQQDSERSHLQAHLPPGPQPSSWLQRGQRADAVRLRRNASRPGSHRRGGRERAHQQRRRSLHFPGRCPRPRTLPGGPAALLAGPLQRGSAHCPHRHRFAASGSPGKDSRSPVAILQRGKPLCHQF